MNYIGSSIGAKREIETLRTRVAELEAALKNAPCDCKWHGDYHAECQRCAVLGINPK